MEEHEDPFSPTLVKTCLGKTEEVVGSLEKIGSVVRKFLADPSRDVEYF